MMKTKNWDEFCRDARTVETLDRHQFMLRSRTLGAKTEFTSVSANERIAVGRSFAALAGER